MSFNSDVKMAAERTRAEAMKIIRAKVLGVMSNIVRRTPVDTGRLRGNWNASINNPDRSVNGGTGAPSSGELSSVLLSADIGDDMYLTNNLDYAGKIEKGSSRQAPSGMMRISVLEAGD